MVIGLPRSGTTWAANWLTAPGEVMVHDPLYYAHYSAWAHKYDAVSCTGIWRWPEFVRQQECPILVLHRPFNDIKASLAEFDEEDHGDWLIPANEDALWALEAPNLWHVDWYDLFDPKAAQKAWHHMRMPLPFSYRRHAELVRMKIEPAAPIPHDADQVLYKRLMAELQEKETRAMNVV